MVCATRGELRLDCLRLQSEQTVYLPCPVPHNDNSMHAVADREKDKQGAAHNSLQTYRKIFTAGNESVLKIITNDRINFISFKLQTAVIILVISNHNCFECCLIKLLPYILFENYIYILAFEMVSPGNQHCAIVSAHFRSLLCLNF